MLFLIIFNIIFSYDLSKLEEYSNLYKKDNLIISKLDTEAKEALRHELGDLSVYINMFPPDNNSNLKAILNSK